MQRVLKTSAISFLDAHNRHRCQLPIWELITIKTSKLKIKYTTIIKIITDFTENSLIALSKIVKNNYLNNGSFFSC